MAPAAPLLAGVRRSPDGGGLCSASWIIGCLWAVMVPSSGVSDPRTTHDASQPHRWLQEFSQGVHIDWQQGVIEVDATVVLRNGPLELVACSPNTREHESILRANARPSDVFHAMGLIGLEPGKPVRYDAAKDHWLPPSGASLRIDVRYVDRGVVRTVPMEQWLSLSERNRPPGALHWVFAGSRRLPDGRFGADTEGTLIGVVDFETALVAVGALHTSSDEQLWLTANTDVIPPIGTSCTLLIARAGPRPVVIEMEVDGTLREDGKTVSVSSVVQETVRKGCDGVSGGVVLQAGKGVSDDALDKAVKALVDKGLDRETIRVLRPTTTDAPRAVPNTRPPSRGL